MELGVGQGGLNYRLMKELKELDPEELLIFLQKLEENLYISDIKIIDDHEELARVDMKLNDILFFLICPYYFYKELGSFCFFNESRHAQETAKGFVVDRLTDYFEEIYLPWLYNDTGFKMNSKFKGLINTQIDKLKEQYSI